MGNQAHAGEPIRRAVELIRSGLLEKLKKFMLGQTVPYGLKD